MGQKVNPVSLRLESKNRHFDNCWYSHSFYKNLINKDILLQNYLNTFLKSVQFPTGRYSIQHLQKKTQIYTFFCYSKFTRKWRSKLLGLNRRKNFYKKKKYFFKTTGRSYIRNQKQNKWISFYTYSNQNKVHNVQKKITSFQNLKLWSLLQKMRVPTPVSLQFQPLSTSTLLEKSSPKFHVSVPCVTDLIPNKTYQNFYLIQKKEFFNEKFLNLQKFSWLSFSNQLQRKVSSIFEVTPNTKQEGINTLFFTENQKELQKNSNLQFLHNLFLYKRLKLSLFHETKKLNHSFFLEKKEKKSISLKTKRKQSFLDKKVYFGIHNNVNNFFQKKKRIELNSKKKRIAFDILDFKYKNYLESRLSSMYNIGLNLTLFKVKNDWQYANFLADEIVYFLQKRIAFRQIKYKILRQLSKISQIRGVRITCSGRVGGKSKKAQRAKMECLKFGQTSLHVFSSPIDFSMKTAVTRFGCIGVKVWICYH